MSDQSTKPQRIQAAAMDNYGKLRSRITDIFTHNYYYFITLAEVISNQITSIINAPVCPDNIDYPDFVKTTIKLQLDNVEKSLEETLRAFDLNNSELLKMLSQMII